MTASKPYTRAVLFSRPAGRRRIEVFSPKLARRLSLGGYDAYRTWLVIEANPRIRTFCERPTYVDGPRGAVIDFWVQRRTADRLGHAGIGGAMVLPLLVPGADFDAFAWAHSPDVSNPESSLKPVRRQRPCAKNDLPMDEASKRERLVSRWRAIARSRPFLPLRPTSQKLALPLVVEDSAADSLGRGVNLLGGCEWLLRLSLREQWAGLCHAERG
jgi:hypothetical protein